MNGSVRYAGFWIRWVAYMIDVAILGVLYIIPSAMLIGGDPEQNTMLRTGFFLILVPISILYLVGMPLTKWQGTIGKKILGLKIVNEHGGRISLGQSVLRYIGYIVNNIIFSIGYIMAAFTNRKRGLHDMIAHTYVIKSRTQVYEQPSSQQASLQKF